MKFIKKIFFESYDVVFYYPTHFKRNSNENEFLKPFYKICENNNLKYLIIEEPDIKKREKIDTDKINFRYILFVIIFLRKIIPLKLFKNFEKRENFIGKLLKPFFIGFKFNNVIIMSNSLEGFFRGLNKTAQIFDYQHGVIHSKHPGYIQNNKTAQHIKENNVKLLLYGKGFKDLLVKYTFDEYYKNNCFIVGRKVEIDRAKLEHKNMKNLILTLQFVDDCNDINEELKKLYLSFLKNNSEFFLKENYILYMKHHPRFKNNIKINELLEFEFVKLVDNDIIELLLKSFLHVTVTSSTIFEAAKVGVPTLLLKSNIASHLDSRYYIDEFDYPIDIVNEKQFGSMVDRIIEKYDFYVKEIKNWYKYYFMEINENIFLKVLNEGIQ